MLYPVPIALQPFGLGQNLLHLLMLGLGLMLLAPRYADALLRHRAAAAARRVISDLALAGNHARAAGGAAIRFDPTSNTYLIEAAPASKTVDLSDRPLCATLFGADFGGTHCICFNDQGLPTHPGQVIVGAGDSQRTITIDPTGQVSLA